MHAEMPNPFPNVRNELIARALSVERLLISTWRECFEPTDAIALVAVGGFGRAELFLHSDVDLLILTPEHIKPELARQISAFEALDKFTEQFKKTSQKMSILKEQKKEYDGFIHAARLIIYEYNNQVELLNIYAVSSPTNLVVLQYSIKIQSNSEIQPDINKMLTFFNQRVHIKKQSITQPQIKLKDSI